MGTTASSLPYSIGDKKISQDGCWDVHDGFQKNDGTPVTVFQAQKPLLAKPGGYREDPSLQQLHPAVHHFTNCKKVRHPHILQVQATLDTDNPNNDAPTSTTTSMSSSSSSLAAASTATTGALIIVTEYAIPLTQWLQEERPTNDQLAWGLQCIVQALSFLHNSAQLAHGCVAPQSFWVTPSGDVKLWNLALVTPIGVADGGGGPTTHFKLYEKVLTPQAYRSPERVSQQWNGIATSGLHCMDSYSLGILINEYYNGRIPGPLQKAVQRLQTQSLKMRPRLGPLLRCPVFDTAYAKFLTELSELHIQPVEQKLRFWQTLSMDAVDPKVAQHKLLPLVRSTIQTIGNSESMMSQDLYRREVLAMIPPLFYIADHVLDQEAIGKELTPLMQLLFTVKDRAVRGALLGKTPLLAQHLSQSDLNQSVFEPLCSGFSDSSDALRELTLKATNVLVPHLYPPNVEKLSRYLVRLQSDTSPSIRTHTMSMIPTLAPHLSVVAREKLLLPAFVRAFRDPHAPCRLAALENIAQAKPYFTLEELATKVLPAVMPLVLDAIPTVRVNAFRVVEAFLAELKQEHEKKSVGDPNHEDIMNLTASTSTSTGMTTTTTTSSSSAGVVPAPSSGSYLSSLSSWYSSSTAPDPTPTTTAPPATTATTSATGYSSSATTTTTRAAPTFSSLNIGGTAPTTTTTSTMTSSAGDGWDDDDDDDDDLLDSFNANDGSNQNDIFASLDMKTTTTTTRPYSVGSSTSSGSSSSKGKLIMKKGSSASNLKPKKPEVKKLDFLDDDDDGDGWDDF